MMVWFDVRIVEAILCIAWIAMTQYIKLHGFTDPTFGRYVLGLHAEHLKYILDTMCCCKK